MMSKASTVYLGLFALLVVGLWLILSFGSKLAAPTDLSGDWELIPSQSHAPARVMSIEQSGRYVQLTLDKNPPLSLQMVEFQPNRIVIKDEHWTFTFEPIAEANEYQVIATGPQPGQWKAKRIEIEAIPKPAAVATSQPASQPIAATPPAAGQGGQSSKGHAILILLVQVALILGLSRLMGVLFNRIGQPQVMGEMLAGIMLGPSLFGLLAPAVWGHIFPPNSVALLNLLSQVGVIFFLFLIGLELDPKLIRNRGQAALVISHASIVAPLLLGALLTMYLYPRIFNNIPTMRFTPVALFMGAAMSITAFPVLARILTERNIHKTKMGAIAITCAAVDDVTAWCMLALVVGYARAEGWAPAMVTAGLSVVYVLVMFFVIKPFLKRLEIVYDRRGRLTQNIVAIIFLLILASAYATERIGIHALFGAFLMGAIMPKGTHFVRSLSEKLEDYTVVFLLPLFFAYTGLKTQIGLLNNSALWIDTLLIIAVACLGKFGGSALAARSCGLAWRESSAIGILMNTRGLMELVILNIGRELGVMSDAAFAMMVIMALVTTALTSPLLNWIFPERLFLDPNALAKTRDQKPKSTYSILIPVSLPRSGKPLAQLASMIGGTPAADGSAGAGGGSITGLYLRRPVDHDAYRSGLDVAAEPPEQGPLEPLLDEARARQIPVEPVSFISRDVAEDIAAVAGEKGSNLVLMGFHKPVIGRTILGGTVHRVLTNAQTDVAIFVDRGMREIHTILVPYMGSFHDRFALDLSARIGRNAKATITVLHIVPPNHPQRQHEAQKAMDRVINDPTQPVALTFEMVESNVPVEVVLKRAKSFDLVVIGVAEQWGLESHLFGWKSEKIARDCPTSLLIVRKHLDEPSNPVSGDDKTTSGNS
ncbi:MAG: cation:proton antiporter [Phycisphaerales bacterium]|nr:cation:proton antiporter [Phycisphaerales bacterium]